MPAWNKHDKDLHQQYNNTEYQDEIQALSAKKNNSIIPKAPSYVPH